MSNNEAKRRSTIHTFDIDNYLNRFVPRSRLYLLPKPISHWFGYRPPLKDIAAKPAPVQTSNLLVWLFAFLGGFIGIAIIENVFLALPLLDGHRSPIVIASFGAAAILEYNAIESPLSQPRNLILGHFLSATIGVAITKLFLLLPPDRFEDLRWLAGALAVGAASTVMGITKTVHPPAGATALIAATTVEVTEIGWWLLPLVLLAGSLMLASAMLINNLYKRFPLFWWTPVDLAAQRQKKQDIVHVYDVEKEAEDSPAVSEIEDMTPPENQAPDVNDESHRTKVTSKRRGSSVGSRASRASRASRRLSTASQHPDFEIRIDVDRIVLPDWMSLSGWERDVLEGFKSRLREKHGEECREWD